LVVICFFHEKLSYLDWPNIIPSTDFLTYTFGDERSFYLRWQQSMMVLYLVVICTIADKNLINNEGGL
jgi:hypothetical protein